MEIDFSEINKLCQDIFEAAQRGEVEWKEAHAILKAKALLFEETVNLQNKIEQIVEAYSPAEASQ
jgi:hypothetical protein